MDNIVQRRSIRASNERVSQTPEPGYDSDSNSSTDRDTSQDLKDSQKSYQNESYANFGKYSQKTGFGVLPMVFILIIILATLAYGCAKWNRNPDQREFKPCLFLEFTKNYPQNEEASIILRAGIENIINGIDDAPAVYLFLHNESMRFNNIILDIAHQASSCFESGKKPVQMDSADFTSVEASTDYGYAIEKYKNKIQEGNVILIVDLNKIPAEAAEALHTICDTTNPIVKKVVILLTLNTQEISDKLTEAAENALNKLWGSKLKRSSLDPLVTRLTDQVIAIK